MHARPAMLIGTVLLVVSCTDGMDWSEREIRNGEQILASLEATSEAARIANAMDDGTALAARRDDLLGELRRGHLLASQVDTIVLEKLHPRMFSKFRLGYQAALAKMIRAYENGDIDAAERAAADIQDFLQWFRTHRHQFRWWDRTLQQ